MCQTLLANGLRERVVLRVDGGFKSGVDVLMAAAMGGDEYGFGSVAMIATGCVMARICHTNNCPVGVASQVSNDAFSDLNFCNAYGSVKRNCWWC